MWDTASEVDLNFHGDLGIVALINKSRDRREASVDGEKEWADLVMQITCDLSAVFFLQRQQLLVQAALFPIKLREFGGHPVETPLKP